MPALTSTKTWGSATCSGSREAPLRRRLARVHYRREPLSQALVDAQVGLAEAGQPLPQRLVFTGQSPGVFHPHDLRAVWTARASRHHRRAADMSVSAL